MATSRQAENWGVPVATLRIGVVLGKQGALPLMLRSFTFGFVTQIGYGKQTLSWIHIDDVLAAIRDLMTADNPVAVAGAYNLTSPHPVTQAEFAAIAAKRMRCSVIVPLPAVLFRMLMGEQAMLLLGNQRIAPDRLLQGGYKFRFSDLDDALEDLAWR